MSKSGELRVLKNGAVYGPFDRAVLEQMIESGRIDPSDQVSVRGSPWMSIADFLSARPAIRGLPSPPAAPTPGLPAPGLPTPGLPAPGLPAPDLPAHDLAAPKKKGSLRILRGNRMVGSLDRDQVEQLYAVGRLGDDDLICAAGGPWMLVGDFLAPPQRAATGTTRTAGGEGRIEPPTPVQPQIVQPPRPRPPIARPVFQPPVNQPPIARPVFEDPAAQPPIARPVFEDLPTAELVVGAPVSGEPAFDEPEWVTPDEVAAETAIRRDLFSELDEPVLKDEWYVRVRGIHSAPLKKQHVRMLLESREITLDAAARHCSWRETDWRPIRSIPQLSGIAE